MKNPDQQSVDRKLSTLKEQSCFSIVDTTSKLSSRKKKKKKKHVCSVCGVVSDSWDLLKLPKSSTHSHKKYRTICMVCNAHFSTLQRLQKHIREAHNEESFAVVKIRENLFSEDEAVKQFFREKAHLIANHVVYQSHQSIFIFTVGFDGIASVEKYINLTFSNSVMRANSIRAWAIFYGRLKRRSFVIFTPTQLQRSYRSGALSPIPRIMRCSRVSADRSCLSRKTAPNGLSFAKLT